MDLGENQGLTNTTPEDLIDDSLVKMSAPKPVPGNGKEDLREAGQKMN